MISESFRITAAVKSLVNSQPQLADKEKCSYNAQENTLMFCTLTLLHRIYQ